MFRFEYQYARYKQRFGVEAGRYFLGLLPKGQARLKRPKQASGYDLMAWPDRWIYELNEHYLEVVNPFNEYHIYGFISLIFSLGVLVPSLMPIYFFLFENTGKPPSWPIIIFAIAACMAGIGFDWYVTRITWHAIIRPACFTLLRGRIRFNRDTRKVYALRPKFCGGNVVLNWDSVCAQVDWYHGNDPAVEDYSKTPDFTAMQDRLMNADRSLVLYWPPHDPHDPEAKGEEALFVGPTIRFDGAGYIWEYIRRYMEEGAEAVPPPAEKWRMYRGYMGLMRWTEYINSTMEDGPGIKKAWHSIGVSKENIPSRRLSAFTRPFTPFLALFDFFAQFLCYWPKFPKEWNSDSGVGEAPIRWEWQEGDEEET